MKHQMFNSALIYNERKCENLKANILLTKNFIADVSDINAMKIEMDCYVRDAERKIKEPYFHAVISCKGNEYSFEQLAKMGDLWMDKMGYGEQPFLIYGHQDTDNNHIHIVSVRVNAQGKKISDKFERLRSQEAIQSILNEDPKLEIEEVVKKCMSYNFSTTAQFRTLIELTGCKTRKHSGNIDVIKYGRVQKSIPIEELENIIKKNMLYENSKRKKQITALLYKYAKDKSEEELKDLFKTKFNIDLVFYKKKGEDISYGFTVVDNYNKACYSGNKMMPVQNISKVDVDEYIATLESLKKVDMCKELCNRLLKENANIDYSEFEAELKKNGYKVYKNGSIYVDGFKMQIKQEIIKSLCYNSRLKEANAFRAKNAEEAYVLCSLYKVKYKDIVIHTRNIGINQMLEYVSTLNKYYATNDIETIKQNGITIHTLNDKQYLIDSKNREIVAMKEFESRVEIKIHRRKTNTKKI